MGFMPGLKYQLHYLNIREIILLLKLGVVMKNILELHKYCLRLIKDKK